MQKNAEIKKKKKFGQILAKFYGMIWPFLLISRLNLNISQNIVYKKK